MPFRHSHSLAPTTYVLVIFAIASASRALQLTPDSMNAYDASGSGSTSRNVLGGPLGPCSTAPKTGFYRNGYCETGPQDTGRHTVCAQVTSAFLAFTRERGNDLSRPNPPSAFPGLRDGDRWCLCVDRWREAEHGGVAPPVDLEATHERALDSAGLRLLQKYALPGENTPQHLITHT